MLMLIFNMNNFSIFQSRRADTKFMCD